MPNTAVRAAATGLPEINRRRLLVGLAAASAAAATITAEATAAPVENPTLLALIAELPAIAQAYHAAQRDYADMVKQWNAATPWAPDELTAPGIAWPHDPVEQPGKAEMKALGGFLWRKGDDFPRRIVVKAWEVDWKLLETKRALRKAKKYGPVADCLWAEEEIKRLKTLYATAKTYETEFAECKKQALADHERLYPAKDAAHEALEKHIAMIMDTPDWTMEGLVIKTQALAEWDRVGTRGFDKVAFKHGRDWHGQIATSILRHAQGGVA